MKKIIPALFLAVILCGCAAPVNYTISDRYAKVRPYTIAVLPVEWAEGVPEDKKISGLFRTMAFERLRATHYRLVPLDAVDNVYQKPGRQASDKVAPSGFGADAAVYIRVTGWETGQLGSYASLKVAAAVEMRSEADAPLWNADYETSERDISLDADAVELSVIKAYEPRIQRFVDAIFSTLPQAQAPADETRFFQWLP
ncbi:MAG: hypothetical protein HY894_09315 [Deltaproteobacteria bacterium]|nr:hypothetical protein [Deltaproteobacteria bacterium]